MMLMKCVCVFSIDGASVQMKWMFSFACADILFSWCDNHGLRYDPGSVSKRNAADLPKINVPFDQPIKNPEMVIDNIGISFNK